MDGEHNELWRMRVIDYDCSLQPLNELNRRLEQAVAEAKTHPRRPSLAHQALDLAQEHHVLFRTFKNAEAGIVHAVAWLEREAAVRYGNLGSPPNIGQPPTPQLMPGFITAVGVFAEGRKLCQYLDRIAECERRLGVPA